MIRSLSETDIPRFAQMTDITDRDIQDGAYELTAPAEYERRIPHPDGLLGQRFTGLDFSHASFEDIINNTRRGFISLPVSIVNTNYYHGRCPELADKLGLSDASLKRIIYCSDGIVTEENDTGFHKGEIIAYSSITDSSTGSSPATLSGADAIEWLLDQKGLPTDRIILHSFPILPIRFYIGIAGRNSQSKHPLLSTLGDEYEKLRIRAVRLRRLIELGVPEVVLRNERRILQETADKIIANGASGPITVSWYGNPAMDMADIYDNITSDKALKIYKREDIRNLPELDKDSLYDAVEDFESVYYNSSPEEPLDYSLREDEAAILNNDKEKILHILYPLAAYIADTLFPDTDISRDALIYCALHNYAYLSSYMFEGFENSIIYYIDRCREDQSDSDKYIRGMASAMANRISKYIRTGYRISEHS